MLQNVDDQYLPVFVVGDIHGQFYDLVNLLEKSGEPGKVQYLFLGDYVDRGLRSMECVILLLSMKIAHPKEIHLLRGNHECRLLTTQFTFRQEVLEKYDEEVYNEIMECFDRLPLAAIVSE